MGRNGGKDGVKDEWNIHSLLLAVFLIPNLYHHVSDRVFIYGI
jgi:hypothetical protein